MLTLFGIPRRRYIQNIVNPWDLARAHVQLSDALLDRPQDVAGQAFAITGQPTAHSFDEIRRMVQVSRVLEMIVWSLNLETPSSTATVI
jgi:hypothetical protein